MTVLFLDANVPMYVAGEEHPLKAPCTRILRLASDYPASFVTDAEVLQELLTRYLALNRRSRAWEVVGDFALVMQGRIEAVTAADVVNAAEASQTHRSLSARDLLHAEVMRRLDVTRLISADSGFDAVGGIERLDPGLLDTWEETLDLN
jgi:predicted nucleic acid-binding protein